MGTGRQFTDTEDRAILLATEMECPPKYIGLALDRLTKTIRTRLLILEAAPEPDVITERKCLRCRAPFGSKGPGNRICEPCDASNARIHATGGWPLHVADGPGIVQGGKGAYR